MTTARDLRAMVAGIERAMQSFRSARGAGSSVELAKACAGLEKEVIDAKAMTILAKRSGVDAIRLEGKIIAAKKLLDGTASATGNDDVGDRNSVRESERSFVTRSDAFDSPASRPEPPRPQISHEQRDDSDAASLRSSVAARHEDQLRLRMEEIALRRKMKDVNEKAEQEAEKARRVVEDLEVRMLAIRHRRVESEVEEKFSQSGSRSSDRSVESSEKRTRAWVDASLIDPPLSPRHVASPSSSQSSLNPNPPPPSAAPDVAEVGFVPVVSKRKTSSTKLKTVQKVAPKAKAATPGTKTTPRPIPRPKVTAPELSAETTPPSPKLTGVFDERVPVDAGSKTAPVGKEDSESHAATLVKLQSQEFAFRYVVSLRPENPFNGETDKIDFDHYLKEFECALSTPGLSAKLRLSEFRFWFIGLASLKIKRFLLRKDEENHENGIEAANEA